MSQKNGIKKCLNQEEELFQVIGEYGPWQRNIAIAFICVNITVSWQNMAITFLAPNPDFKCIATEYGYLNSINASSLHLISFTSNTSYQMTHTKNQCEYSMVLEPPLNPDTEEKSVLCTKWDYQTSDFPRTLVNEWDLVCEREWLVSFGKSIYMFGFMASSLIFGQFSDSFGRFPTIIVCWVIMCISGILSAFSTSYLMFAILRFFLALGGVSVFNTGYIVVMEVIGPKWRKEIGLIVHMGFVIGMTTFPAIAWLTKSWVQLQLAICVPTLGFISAFWIVPESPRWLMTQRKRKQFELVITKAARKNGLDLASDIGNVLPFSSSKSGEDEVKKATNFDLVRTPQIRKQTFIMAMIWAVNGFVYYGFSYNTNDLAGNHYLNFFLSAVVEFPAFVFVIITVRKLSRKVSIFSLLIIGGIASVTITGLPYDVNWLIITLAMIGKLCITSTYGIIYLYAAELFPTVIRNLAIGICAVFSTIGSITAPFSRELGKATNTWVPNALNAGLMFLAGLLVIFLPETKNKKLPDTIAEGEEINCSTL